MSRNAVSDTDRLVEVLERIAIALEANLERLAPKPLLCPYCKSKWEWEGVMCGICKQEVDE